MPTRKDANPFVSQLDPIVPTPYSRKLAPEAHSAPAAAQPQTMLEAVRDVVTIRGTDGRQKVSRSQTGGLPSSSAPSRTRRSQSQDSTTHNPKDVPPKDKDADKLKAKSATGKSKKGSTHVDVIDRLDFTGVGAAMFHHDGPFDACAPSRNRHRNKAPMLAWTPADESSPVAAAAQATTAPKGRRLEPIPASEIAAMAATPGPPVPPKSSRAKQSMDDSYFGVVPEPASPKTKRRHDALAEAWGRHEPEPYEEFFAASPAITAAREEDTRRSDRPLPQRKATNKPPPPPPQPISLPGAWDSEVTNADSGLSQSPPSNGPRRSKSLMHRIRKMRDNPNVPVGYDDDITPEPGADFSPPSSDSNHPGGRPSREHRGSILGRLGKTNEDEAEGPPSPTKEAFESSSPPVSSPGIGRKQSIMKKVRGVVGGRAK